MTRHVRSKSSRVIVCWSVWPLLLLIVQFLNNFNWTWLHFPLMYSIHLKIWGTCLDHNKKFHHIFYLFQQHKDCILQLHYYICVPNLLLALTSILSRNRKNSKGSSVDKCSLFLHVALIALSKNFHSYNLTAENVIQKRLLFFFFEKKKRKEKTTSRN